MLWHLRPPHQANLIPLRSSRGRAAFPFGYVSQIRLELLLRPLWLGQHRQSRRVNTAIFWLLGCSVVAGVSSFAVFALLCFLLRLALCLLALDLGALLVVALTLVG